MALFSQPKRQVNFPAGTKAALLLVAISAGGLQGQDFDTAASETLNVSQPVGAGEESAIPMNQEDASFRPLRPNDTPLGQAGEKIADSGSEVGEEVVEAQVRRWRVRPIAGFSVHYDDNIFISSKNREGDTIFSLNGGLGFDLGDYRSSSANSLTADYVATGLLFVDHSRQNSLNHDARLMGQYALDKVTFRLDSLYQYVAGADRDVGNFARRHTLNNGVTVIYDYSDKTQLDAAVRQVSTIYESYNSSYETFGTLGFSYELQPKLHVGLEGRFGVLDGQDQPRQTYQQARVRGVYDFTGKLTFNSTAGVDLRQFQHSGKGTAASPVFTLAAEYQPRENTTLTLEGYRNIYIAPSYDDQNITVTGVALAVSQKFFQKLEGRVTTGYEHSDYSSTERGSSTNRADNYFFVRPAATMPVYKWINAGVFYEFRRNVSNQENQTFRNNRVGLELTAQF